MANLLASLSEMIFSKLPAAKSGGAESSRSYEEAIMRFRSRALLRMNLVIGRRRNSANDRYQNQGIHQGSAATARVATS